MEIIVAKTAGFCFGVNRALDMVDKLLNDGRGVATLGPIIHNSRLVQALSQKGARVIESVGDALPDEVVVVRSHGISRSAYDEIDDSGLAVCDATCPFVSKIHSLVSGADPDTGVLIAGDKDHPEILGITGHCRGDFYVFADEEELKNHPFHREKALIMVAQTTYNQEKWIKCTRIAKEHYTNLKIFDTICNATSMRQNEASELSKICDTMLIVGDPGSSNTCKLFELCAHNCRAYLIEGADELTKEMFPGARKVGITAGASTPAFIIKEVLETMNAIERETDVEEFSFEEALEQSLKTAHTNQKVVGTVTAIAPNEVQVDIGTKHAGYIPMSELSDDPSVKPEDILSKGDKINVVVMKVNDAEGTVMLSKKRFDALEGYDRVSDASQDGTVLSGVVTDVVKGGVIVLTNGVRVFVPASQATVFKNDLLEDLKGQNVNLRIIEMGKGRRSIIGSIRSVLVDERNRMRDEFWEKVEVGQTYQGPVKSTTSYGAFIDLGGVDGMVHISELSWKRIKNPSEVVKVGDVLEVFVKDVDKEKKKISLGFKKMEDNPWELLKRSHEVGDVVDGKVVSLTQFGAFVNIMDGIDGLVHISQIAQERVEKASDVLKKGQEVQTKILDIDYDKKRVSLSIKALLDEAPDIAVDEYEQTESAMDEAAQIEPAEEATEE